MNSEPTFLTPYYIDIQYITLAPNVLVKWLTFLLRIQEVPASNLGPETGYPD
jgi:hypothetical protein